MNDDGLPSRALDNINNNNTNNNNYYYFKKKPPSRALDNINNNNTNNNNFEKKPLQSINSFCYTLIQQLFGDPLDGRMYHGGQFLWRMIPGGYFMYLRKKKK